MSALDHIATARNDAFSGRVLMIAMKVAQMVASEAASEPNHVARVEYAAVIFRGDEHQQLLAAHVISSNPTMQAAIDAQPGAFGSNVPDNDIEFALSSIWTARALAFTIDAPPTARR